MMPADDAPFANVLQPLIDGVEKVLLSFHDTMGVGWGLAIILLTLSVRLVLLPLTVKPVTSMRRLQLLAPAVKSIQEKHNGNKQRQQQEIMKLYRENGANPLSSFLPLLLELPFFIALFVVARTDLKTHICPGIESYAASEHETVTHVTCSQFGDSTYVGAHHITVADPSFGFIPDLTAKATGVALIVLIVLYVVTQLASGVLSSASLDRSQRMIVLGLPIVFVALVINIPAALVVYWIATNCWTITQQMITRQTVGLPGMPRGVPAGAAVLTQGRRGGSHTTAQRKLSRREKVSQKGVANGAPARAGHPPSRRRRKRTGRR